MSAGSEPSPIPAAPPSPQAQRRFTYSSPAPAQTAVLASQAGLDPTRIAIGLLAIVAAIAALFPNDLIGLVNRWISDSGWSHGFVVPFISLFFIRLKWDSLRGLTPRRSAAGLAILILGIIGQIIFRATALVPMCNLSLVVILLGGTLFIFGWDFMKILWLPIVFLVFAIPPHQPLYAAVTSPLQALAARVGTTLLPLFGIAAETHGNTIYIDGLPGGGLDVAQACSGMKMLVAFFALAVALAYSGHRPTWQKIFLALCALPTAILCNSLRVTLTGVMGVYLGESWSKGAAHEYLGLLMLIPALLIQLAIAWILDHIFIEVPDEPAGKREVA